MDLPSELYAPGKDVLWPRFWNPEPGLTFPLPCHTIILYQIRQFEVPVLLLNQEDWEILEGCLPFGTAPPPCWTKSHRRAGWSSSPPGATVYSPSHFCRCLGILLAGRLQVTKGTLTVSYLEPGDLFGAAALYTEARNLLPPLPLGGAAAALMRLRTAWTAYWLRTGRSGKLPVLPHRPNPLSVRQAAIPGPVQAEGKTGSVPAGPMSGRAAHLCRHRPGPAAGLEPCLPLSGFPVPGGERPHLPPRKDHLHLRPSRSGRFL